MGGNQQKLVIAKWLMRKPRIILLNDPTRGIDVGTKQEIYVLLRRLADDGAAVLLYSTDYDELIGLCDKVLVLYDGAVKRTLAGAEITERALIGSALNIDTDIEGAARRAGDGQMSDWRYRFAEQRGTLLALLMFVVMFAIYLASIRRSSTAASPSRALATWCRRPPTRACCWRSSPWRKPLW